MRAGMGCPLSRVAGSPSGLDLPPVPLRKNVAVAAMVPRWRDPLRVAPRRYLPAALFPHIAAPIPTLITANPYMLTTGRRTPMLRNHPWRRDSHDDVSGLYRTHSDSKRE